MSSKNMLVFSIVVYNEFFWESITFNSLLSSFSKNKNNEEINIYIYDNSVRSQNIDFPEFENDINIKYFAFNENRGISKAYNHLVSLALKDGFKWIVFLDQDTMLPLDFYYKYFDSWESDPLPALPDNYKPYQDPKHRTHPLLKIRRDLRAAPWSLR